jgi:hypothetical protein
MATLLIAIFAGAFGMGYFVYGKREQKAVPLISGVLLCVYPYFVDNALWSIFVGAALLAAPFLLDF